VKKIIITVAAAITLVTATAQYAPQAGIGGSTAISSSSSQIVSWANTCKVYRGYTDIAQPSLGYVTSGDSSLATGPANFFVVSLGDSGVAVLTFPQLIVNGPGPDFAVFENGFTHPADPEKAFLELAFVEVSSDGNNFFRFPAVSQTQADTQIAGAGIYMNARQINNLAGKYISNYGTPFDLQELSGIPGLDLDHITHVRIVDVIGSVDGHSSYDANNNIINDPYPTAFPIGGFDLDAVAVLHAGTTSVPHKHNSSSLSIYPNPVTDLLTIKSTEPLHLTISDVTGKVLKRMDVNTDTRLNMAGYTSGIYFLSFTNNHGHQWVERISKQ
jgi:hypothetical protein